MQKGASLIGRDGRRAKTTQEVSTQWLLEVRRWGESKVTGKRKTTKRRRSSERLAVLPLIEASS